MSASYLAAAETRTADRPKRGLKVIGAGCGRTGTASLKAALETLGFDPCYHMFEVVKNGHSTRWTEAFSSPSTADWAGLVEGFEASVDFPASTAYVELMAAFPDAKVVLSVRDPKSWARSVRDTIWSPYGGELSWVMAPFRRDFQKMTRLFRARFFGDADGGVRSGAIFDDAVLAARFEAWNALVIATVPKERLLVFRAADGWGPLCKFLDVPEPAVPYPNVNDTAEFKERLWANWRMAAAKEAALLLLVFGGAVALKRRI